MNGWKCPECERIIKYLRYSQAVTEYGDFSLNDDPEDDESPYDNGEHNCDDSDSGDDCYYTCPECDVEISPSDLLIVRINDDGEEIEEEDEEEDEEDNNENLSINQKELNKKKKPIDRTKVIRPDDDFAFDDENENIPEHIKCTKCKSTILITMEDKRAGETIDCPKCSKTLKI